MNFITAVKSAWQLFWTITRKPGRVDYVWAMVLNDSESKQLLSDYVSDRPLVTISAEDKNLN